MYVTPATLADNTVNMYFNTAKFSENTIYTLAAVVLKLQ
jgi:hypothetical protein